MSNVPENKAVEGHWIVANPMNRGENKKYNGVGGHLMAIAGHKSFEYGNDGYVYGMAANQELLEYYILNFRALPMKGLHFYISGNAMLRLLNIYNFTEN